MPIESVCIASCVDISVPCGGTNRIIAFTDALIKAGFDVHLVIPRPKRQLPELDGVKLYLAPVVSEGIKTQVSRAVTLSYIAKKIVKETNSLLQIEFSAVAGIASLLGCNDFIVDVHDLSEVSPIYSPLPFSKLILKSISNLEKLAYIKSLKIITVSIPMKKYIVSRYSIDEEKIYVIQNGYFKSKFVNLFLNNSKKSNLNNNFKISFLGTLLPKIDINKIILLAKSLKNVEIYIIGDGPIRPKLEKLIKKYNLENVIVTGRLPDEKAFKLVAESQVVIYPLKELGPYTKILTSVKIFDYSILGKAMVLDDVSESEVWREYKEKQAAVFSDPNNPDDFVDCVRTLLEDEKLRKKIGLKAKKIAEKYTWEKMGEKLVKLYEEVLK